MREIKFRAWDTEQEKMTICMTLDEIIEKGAGVFHRMVKDDFIWMQFTGLEDKEKKKSMKETFLNVRICTIQT